VDRRQRNVTLARRPVSVSTRPVIHRGSIRYPNPSPTRDGAISLPTKSRWKPSSRALSERDVNSFSHSRPSTFTRRDSHVVRAYLSSLSLSPVSFCFRLKSRNVVHTVFPKRTSLALSRFDGNRLLSTSHGCPLSQLEGKERCCCLVAVLGHNFRAQIAIAHHCTPGTRAVSIIARWCRFV